MGDNMGASRNLDFINTHLRNLREKLNNVGCANYIKAVYGMGF